MNHAATPEAPECKSLAWAHPLVREWFVAKFGTPTEPQELGWPHILARRNTLICAPTGSGKTLAAFLACIDALVRKALAGDLLDQTEVLYVSPLKALGNDIQKNLDIPLGEILQLAHQRYRVWRIEAEVIEPACAIDLVGWSSSPVRDMCGQHRFDLFVALHPVLLRIADREKRAALTVFCATLTR